MQDTKIKVCVRKDECGQTAIWTEALSRVDPDFHQIIGTTQFSSKWRNSFYQRASGWGVAAFVSSNQNSIGYVVLGDANLYGLHIPLLRKNNLTIKANLTSILYAVSELGQSFGNNGDDPDHLTADLTGARSVLAWPMVAYVYLVIRKDTLRANATCATRNETLQFWLWFYTSPAATQVTNSFDFSIMPENLRATVMKKLQADFLCNGETLTKEIRPIYFGISDSLFADIQFLLRSYNVIFYPATTFLVDSLNDAVGPLDMVIRRFPLHGDDIRQTQLQLRLPFAVNGLVFIYNCVNATTLVLNSEIVENILSGEIKTWNHKALVLLNPQLQQVQHSISFYFSIESFELHTQLLGSWNASGRSLALNLVETDIQALLQITETPYSLAVVPYSNRITMNALSMSSFLREDGSVVHPCLQAFRECAKDTWDLNLQFDLPSSANPKCYPFTYSYYIEMKDEFYGEDCDGSSSPGQILAQLAKWALKRGRFDAVTQSSFSVIYSLNDMIFKQIKKKLLLITCNGDSILSVSANYNYVSEWAFPTAVVFVSFTAFLGLFFICCLIFWKKDRLVKWSQPEFLVLFIFGAVVLSLALIPLALDDKGEEYYNLDDELDLSLNLTRLNRACVSIPWIYITGFSLEFSALFVKVYRLKRIVLSKRLNKVRLPLHQLLPIILGFLFSSWIICLVWTVRDPLHWKRVPLNFNFDGYMTASYGHCTSDKFSYFVGAFVSLYVGLLLTGCVLCYETRNVKEEYVEGKWIYLILLNLLSTLLFSVLLGFFMISNPKAMFVIFLINVSMTGAGSMILIMVPKVVSLVVKNFLLSKNLVRPGCGIHSRMTSVTAHPFSQASFRLFRTNVTNGIPKLADEEEKSRSTGFFENYCPERLQRSPSSDSSPHMLAIKEGAQSCNSDSHSEIDRQ